MRPLLHGASPDLGPERYGHQRQRFLTPFLVLAAALTPGPVAARDLAVAADVGASLDLILTGGGDDGVRAVDLGGAPPIASSLYRTVGGTEDGAEQESESEEP